MSRTDLQRVKQTLVAAGVEIYRTQPEELALAERVRLHIMDSGVRVRLAEELGVAFTARSQRSDFPGEEADALFRRVRETIGEAAGGRGYEEESSRTVEVKDPMNEATVLDTWHEVTYTKATESEASLLEEVRWALSLEKYVTP